MEIKSENNLNVSNQSVWLYDEIQSLINIVKSKPFLYDKKDADYNKNQKKISAWERISEILKNKSPKECKRKWSTLRIQQRRILLQNVMKKRKSVQWQFYEPLQFLTPHMEMSVGTENTNQSNISDDHDYDSEEDENDTSSLCIENDSKNFPLINNSPTNNETSNLNLMCHRSTTDNNQIIISYNNEQPQDCMPSEHSRTLRSSDVNKSVVVSSTFSNLPENQCNFSKGGSDNNSISLNYFLMDIQLQMGKLNELAQMELKIDIQKLILEKLRKPDNLKNE